jgi:hypothetical protein
MTEVIPPPKGQPFSRLYTERGAPLPDSKRFRVRLGEFYRTYVYSAFRQEGQICSLLQTELGVEIPVYGYGRAIPSFLSKADIRDVLSSITYIYEYLAHARRRAETWELDDIDRAIQAWPDFVNRVFHEENLAYKIDDKCGVHPLRDIEYERNVGATISGLNDSRYAAVRDAFRAARDKLDQTSPDTKGAIRDAFEAVETLTKLITASGKALDTGFVKSEIQPRVQRLYESDSVAKMTGVRAAESFADWVNAAHPYRHGHEAQEPVHPPLELAVLLVSQAASFIRWLADLGQQIAERKSG